MRARLALLPLALVVLAGCPRPPRPLAVPVAPLTVAEARTAAAAGQRVRWGGEIVATSPEQERTCFEVVSFALDERARPRRTDETHGRFVACARGFYDPAVWARGRELTVVGTVVEHVTGKVGEHDYRFPRVDAEVVHLWPRPVRREVVYPPYWGPYYDPFWYPYWGWGFGLGWRHRLR